MNNPENLEGLLGFKTTRDSFKNQIENLEGLPGFNTT